MPSVLTSSHDSQPSAKLVEIARRLVWWLPPEEARSERALFLAQAMTFGTWDDLEWIRAELGTDSLRATLTNPPPGIFDAPSWQYWHHALGVHPIPPLPKRKIP